MTDPHQITTVAELREVVGAKRPGSDIKNRSQLDRFARAFISESPFLILSTADAQGNVDTSPKGDSPGFVVIENDHSLLIPDRPGNKLAYGHLNVLENSRIGLLFLIPGTPETLRINGQAELTRDPAVLETMAARGKPAVLATRVEVEECFFHCAKAFMRSDLWNPQSWSERKKISFGQMYKEWIDGDDSAASAVDAAVASDYRENL